MRLEQKSVDCLTANSLVERRKRTRRQQERGDVASLWGNAGPADVPC